MPKTIEKKIWPEYFGAIKSGEKNFEVRLADFEANKGDTLLLREWDPETKQYTGRSINKTVNYIIKTKNMQKMHTAEEVEKYGFLVLGLK